MWWAHRRLVVFVAANEQQTAVNFGVQRFDAAIQHFGKAGVFAHVFHVKPGFAQRFGGAAGGKEFDPAWARIWANGTRPVLSETEINAR